MVADDEPSSAAAQNSDHAAGIHKKHSFALLIVCILILSVATSFFVFFIFRRKLFLMIQRRFTPQGRLKAEKLMLRGFEVGELEKATNNFSEECLLGHGAFGNVYKGNFHLQDTLAIKRARPNSYQTLQEFRNGDSSFFTPPNFYHLTP